MSLTHAEILLRHGRYDLAEEQVRRALAESPDDARAHGLLGLVLLHRDRHGDAEAAARRAVSLEPADPWTHYVLGHVLVGGGKLAEARAAADEAVRLDPESPEHFALLAHVFLAAQRWRESLDAAERGLALDAEHQTLSNLRATALTHLGRRDEATQTIRKTLADNPENDWSHANSGWGELHANRPRRALEHFREALRLNPENDWAKGGLVEALKAKNPIYRVLLAYFLWMIRLNPRVRMGVLVGAFVLYLIGGEVAATNPGLSPYLTPLLVAYLVFAVLTWVAMPLFNLLLRLNRFGRYALSDEQRRGSTIFGLGMLLPIGALTAGIVASWATGSTLPGRLGGFLLVKFGLLLLPLAFVSLTIGRPRFPLFAAGMAALYGFAVVTGVAVVGGWSNAAGLQNAYSLAFIGAIWGVVLFAGRRPAV